MFALRRLTRVGRYACDAAQKTTRRGPTTESPSRWLATQPAPVPIRISRLTLIALTLGVGALGGVAFVTYKEWSKPNSVDTKAVKDTLEARMMNKSVANMKTVFEDLTEKDTLQITEYYGWEQDTVPNPASRSYGPDVSFMYGPQGCGKSEMVMRLLRERKCGRYIPLRGVWLGEDSTGFLDHVMKKLGVLPVEGHMSESYALSCVRQFLRGWKDEGKPKPLIIIDDIEKTLDAQGELPDSTVNLFGCLSGLQRAHLVDVLLVSSDSGILPLLRPNLSGGEDQIRVLYADWPRVTPKLRTFVQKFCGCDSESADAIMVHSGGDLKHIEYVRNALHRQAGISVPAADKPPASVFTMEQVKSAVGTLRDMESSQAFMIINEKLTSIIRSNPVHYYIGVHMLKELAQCTKERGPEDMCSVPRFNAHKTKVRGLKAIPTDTEWLEAGNALVETNLLRVRPSDKENPVPGFELYRPSRAEILGRICQASVA